MGTTRQSGYMYRAAKDFAGLASLGYNDGNFLPKHVMAIVANYALAAELLLKASDAKVIQSSRGRDGPLSQAKIGSNAWGHKLSDVFDNLNPEVAKSLQTAFEEITSQPLVPLLEKCKDYFVNARYYYESGGSMYDVSGIKLLADGLDAAMWKAFGPIAE